MKYRESLRLAMLAPFLAALVVVMLSTLGGIYRLEKNNIDARTNTQLTALREALDVERRHYAQRLRSLLGLVVANAEIRGAWRKKGRNELYQVAQPLFDRMRADYRLYQLSFVDSQRRPFLQMHEHELQDFRVERRALDAAARAQTAATSLEIGLGGTLTLCAAAPVYEGETLLGYVEIAQDIDGLAHHLADEVDAELLFYIDKRLVPREHWERGFAAGEQVGIWHDLKDAVLVHGSPARIPAAVLDTLELSLADGRTFSVNGGEGEGARAGGIVRLADLGVRLGAVAMIRDTTIEIKTLHSLLATLVAFYVPLCAALGIFFYLYAGKIDKRVRAAQTALADQVTEREQAQQVLARHRDELELRVAERTETLRLANLELESALMRHRQAEEQLIQFKSTLDRTHDCVFMFEPQSLRFIYVNQGAMDQVGYSGEELLQMTPLEIKPEFDEKGFRNFVQPLMQGRKPSLTFETVHRHRNGTVMPVEILLQYIALAGGPPRFVAIVRDITERKRVQNTLHELNESLEKRVRERARELEDEKNFIAALLETQSALVLVLDADGRIMRFNRTCEEIYGASFEELRGAYMWELMPEEDREQVRNTFLDLGHAQLPRKIERYWMTRRGERRLIAWSTAAISGPDKGVRYIIGTGIDITQREAAERAALEAKEEAEQASRYKTEFVSRVSHELRTPMNAILGFAQLLESDTDPPLSTHQRDMLTEIINGGTHLLELVNDILDLTRIEAGKLKLTMQDVGVAEVMRECVALVRPLAEQRGIALHVAAGLMCGRTVYADRMRLKEIIINLLSNAVKYNHSKGYVDVDCTETAPGRVRIAVSDAGPGIAPEMQGRLFLPFERLDAGGQIEGTGIGLALTKRLAELMGGTMGLASALGVGSTFWVELAHGAAAGHACDVAPVAAASTADAAKVTSPVCEVLYVEDNAVNMKLVARLLARRPQIRLIEAATPQLGLELAVRHRPALILLDINLPDIDGYEVLARLRAMPQCKTTPIVALSASCQPADIEHGRMAGFDDYLSKPIATAQFFATIDRYLGTA